MTLRSWAGRLLARPATRPARKAPAWGPSATESLEERVPSTITRDPAGGKARRHRGPSAPREQALKSLVHTGRCSPVTIGFWLGGGLLGTGGCLLGALMPYNHPVAKAISVLWWGLYFGCFGTSVGALVGVLTDRAPPRPWMGRERAEEVATRSELESRAARAGSTALCEPRGQQGPPGHQRERERPA
jgi:hypothetical protein